MKFIDEQRPEIIFLPRRGLYIGDPRPFTWLAAGVFAELCSIAAHAKGQEPECRFDHSPMYPQNDFETSQAVASLHLSPVERPVQDLDAELVFTQHTSQLSYDGPALPEMVGRQ